jgi:hypothetical protein
MTRMMCRFSPTVLLKDGLYHIQLDKALLRLTKQELIRALQRGKWWKRRTALAQRWKPQP